jgi:hypothetical protein
MLAPTETATKSANACANAAATSPAGVVEALSVNLSAKTSCQLVPVMSEHLAGKKNAACCFQKVKLHFFSILSFDFCGSASLTMELLVSINILPSISCLAIQCTELYDTMI